MTVFQSLALVATESYTNRAVSRPTGRRAHGRPPRQTSHRRAVTTHELDNTVAQLLGDERGRATATLVVDEFVPFDNESARLMQKMKDTPEAGGNVLDNTVLVHRGGRSRHAAQRWQQPRTPRTPWRTWRCWSSVTPVGW